MRMQITPSPSCLPQGVLAANIFDWGAKACVDLYQSATILEMYREVGVQAQLWRGGGKWGKGMPWQAEGQARVVKAGRDGQPGGELSLVSNCLEVQPTMLLTLLPALPRSALQARTRLSQRPWRVDDFDAFAEVRRFLG